MRLRRPGFETFFHRSFRDLRGETIVDRNMSESGNLKIAKISQEFGLVKVVEFGHRKRKKESKKIVEYTFTLNVSPKVKCNHVRQNLTPLHQMNTS